jgi:O-methyltransferase
MAGEDFTDAPKQSLGLVRRMLPRAVQPLLRGAKKRLFRLFRSLEEPYYSIFPYTLVHPIKQKNLLRLATEIETRNVPGAVVECGVLDGGTAALMAYGTARSGRTIHLFDSWSGLPATSEKDGEAAKVWTNDAVGSPNRVTAVMRRLKIDLDRVVFHQGWFDETFPKAHIGQIALLHIDADFYDSVRLCLEKWAPAVTPGGYIQIDDYAAFIGCRRAVDEFLSRHPDLELQTFGQYSQAYFIKKPRSSPNGET